MSDRKKSSDKDIKQRIEGAGIPRKKAPAKNEPDKKSTGKKDAEKKKSKKVKPKRSLWNKIVFTFFSLVGIIVISGAVGALMVYSYFSQDLPPTDSLKNYRPQTVTFFYSDDGRLIGEYSHERRIVVPLEKIPEHVRHAFIAAEDANFYKHQGVDFEGILRAFIKNIEAGRIVQGGSTITQQVISSFLLKKEKTYERKIKEAILAMRISGNLSKDEVLYLYLNQIYLGHGAWGVESAANLYFDKHVNELTLGEASLLAGLPQAPSKWSPFSNFEAARNRQVYTVEQMLKNGFINEEQARAALAEKLEFHERPNVNLEVTPYFTEEVRRIMVEKYGEDRVYNDGFKVYTTVNIEYQKSAREAVAKGIREFVKRRPYSGPIKKLNPIEMGDFLKAQTRELAGKPLTIDADVEAVVTAVDSKNRTLAVRVGKYEGTVKKEKLLWAVKGNAIAKVFEPGDLILVRMLEKDEKNPGLWFSLEQKPVVQSALMSIDNTNGAVKAMIGGRDFNESQFNRAIQSRRQPGSSFKPVIYTAAMDNGFTPGSILIDSPIVYDDFAHGRRWKPTNFDRKFYGPTDLYTGLTSSRNVMAIKLLSKVGYPAVIETARKLGITSPLPENLSLALGSQGVSLEEMTAAFTTFANLGERVVPMYITRIEDRDGNVIEEFEPIRKRVISSGTACAVQHMLLGVVAHGTGVRVKALGRPVGGKTGTTNDLADAWFIGFTPEYTTGVWVGRDSMERMGWGESGGRAAAPIFLDYMKTVLEGKPVQEFEVPPDAVIVNNGSVGICYKKGTVGTGYSETSGATGEDVKDL